MFHVLDAMRLFRCNLSCFSTERKHRESKGIAAFAFRQWTDTMLRRTLGSFLDYARSTEGFAPYAVEDPKPFDAPRFAHQQVEYDRRFLLAHGLQLEGKSLLTPVGRIHQGDLVAFRSPRVAVGFVTYLLQHRDGDFFAYLQVLPPLGGASFSTDNSSSHLFPAAALLGSFPYYKAPLCIVLVASADSLG